MSSIEVRQTSSATCVDLVRPNAVVLLGEWAMAQGRGCCCTLVAQTDSKALCLARSTYLHYVKPYRTEATQLDGALFITSRFPADWRTKDDDVWLEETPLASGTLLRELPRSIRGRALRQGGRHLHLKAGEILVRQGDAMEALYLVLRGSVRLGAGGTALLQVGEVLGNPVPPDQGQVIEHWQQDVSAEEACDLLEVRIAEMQTAVKDAFQEMTERVTLNLPLQALERITEVLSTSACRHRSVEQLQILAVLLDSYEDFEDLDASARLTLCQHLYMRPLATGEALTPPEGKSPGFCSLLSGELGYYAVSASGALSEMPVMTVPQWGIVSQLPIESDGAYGVPATLGGSALRAELRAMRPSSALCLDYLQVQHVERNCFQGQGTRELALETLRTKNPKQREDADIEILQGLLRSNTFYSMLDTDVLHEVCRCMEWAGFAAGTPIIKSGDVADSCFVLLLGSAGVWIEASTEGDETLESTARKENTTKHLSAERAAENEGMKTEGTISFLTQVENEGPGGSTSDGVDSKLESKESPEMVIIIDSETGGPVGGRLVKFIGEGACFGETGLLHSVPRTATIVAKEQCECGQIKKDVFDRVLKSHFQLQNQKRVAFLKAHLPHPKSGGSIHFQHLASFFCKQTTARGTELCKRGRPCSRLYIIEEGSCRVLLHRDGHPPKTLGEVGVGQLVGVASSFLGVEGEPYTIVCASSVQLWAIEATEIKTRMSPELRSAIADVEQERLDRLEQRAQQLEAIEPALTLEDGEPEGGGRQRGAELVRVSLPAAQAGGRAQRCGAHANDAAPLRRLGGPTARLDGAKERS